ncbi:MAG: cytochrome c biogenesis protein CcsA [Saprospiraceae bacterium]|nr:cytochrome c biogenesis protein CcsA [Saprospiraceae bacterium]
MDGIQYLGEHYWVQILGHALVLTGFLSSFYVALLGIKSYFKKGDELHLYHRWSRIGFFIHALSLLGIIGLILFMMSNHFYEYHYVWEHVSDDLPMKYILSAFWEGQEGSFLLWMFWNIVICIMLIRHYNQFTWMNIGIIMIVQGVLMSMILGVYVFGFKLGSSPFLLLRQTMDIPLFKNPDYVRLIEGNGMNPLLQNYWMLIHPPTLFLGFASTIIPFSYALSGLITRKYTEWLKPCLKWSLFSASFLCLGILMGGIWAYEALSFGGYWAWDPVENMSLVPWLVLIAGIHSHLIAQSTGYSVKATFLFYFLSFALVIYSTYLTRSGVLGDTSVHAFTGLGLGWQLVGFIFLILIIPIFFLIRSRKEIPVLDHEESMDSREFWMFIGSLILLFSAVLISFTTSIPVYNKLLDFIAGLFSLDWKHLHRSAPVDVISHHNRFQIWIAIIVALLSGFGLYLRYMGKNLKGLPKLFFKQIVILLFITLILCIVVTQFVDRKNSAIYLLTFSALFAIISNTYYILSNLKANSKMKSAIISHTGFGILLLGVIFTGLNRKNIVPDKFFQEDILLNDAPEAVNRHFLLFKNEKKFADGYWLNYTHDTLEGRFRNYTINVESEGNKNEKFAIYPDVQYDNKLTKVASANPYIVHYWNRDLFTLIAQIPTVQMDAENAKKAEDSLQYKSYNLRLNDTVFTESNYFVLKGINKDYKENRLDMSEDDFGLSFRIETGSIDDSIHGELNPSIVFQSNQAFKFSDKFDKNGVKAIVSDSISLLISKLNSAIKPELFELKADEVYTSSDGTVFKLIGFDKNPKSKRYDKEEGDISLSARVEISKNDKEWIVEPIYFIRDRFESDIPYVNYSREVQLAFKNINPETGEMAFEYTALKLPDQFPIQIAENAQRTDYLVMEIIVFPGIRLVWLGSLMMVLGLAIGSYNRRK